MIRLLFILFFPLILTAQEVDIEQIDQINNEINRATLSPSETCEHCAAEVDQETINKSLTLNQDEMTISTHYIGGDDFVIALKRTASTPKKVKLIIEYGERVCSRTIAYQNPLSGQLGFDCLFYQTQKRSKTVHLDFTKASVLDGEEFQSLRLTLNKESTQSKIKHKLTMRNGMFDDIEGDKGLFRYTYNVIQKPATRAPAVVDRPTYE